MSAARTARRTLPLHTAGGVREIERLAVAEGGLPGAELMVRAGEGAFRALARRWRGAHRIAVVCGTGNNAGDGFVVARRAREAGRAVRVFGVGDRRRLGPDAAAMLGALRAAGGEVEPFSASALRRVDVIVDALFGIGLSRPVRGEAAAAVSAMNEAAAPVAALDVPSGLDADTGRVRGAAVRAALTVTFIAGKRGLHTGAGPDHCGEIELDTLGVPGPLAARVPAAAARLDYDDGPPGRSSLLAARPRGAHKGHHGHVLVVGGEEGFAGAARLAAEAAARVGAGLVSVATRATHAAALSAARPEIMSRGVEDEHGLAALAERAAVVAVGPGLGREAWGERMFTGVLGLSSRPLVVDADALNHLAALGADAPRRGDWILTPHPGEAGRLLGAPAAEVEADRFAAASAIRARYGGVCVLKGAGTLVAAGRGPIGVCVNGNPGMGTGGTGDVLTGVVAGLAAQGAGLAEAAALGVCIQGKAGDRAAARDGERGLLAGDLIGELRRLVNPG